MAQFKPLNKNILYSYTFEQVSFKIIPDVMFGVAVFCSQMVKITFSPSNQNKMFNLYTGENYKVYANHDIKTSA